MPTYRKASPKILEYIENASLDDLIIAPVYGLTVTEKLVWFEKTRQLLPEMSDSILEQMQAIHEFYPNDPKYLFRVIEPQGISE